MGTLAEAKQSKTIPTYRRGLKLKGSATKWISSKSWRKQQPAALLGGQHLTHYGYLPFLLIKSTTMSSRQEFTFVSKQLSKVRKYEKNPQKATEKILSTLDWIMGKKSFGKERFRNVTELVRGKSVCTCSSYAVVFEM